MFQTYEPKDITFPTEEEIRANDMNFLFNWAREVGFKEIALHSTRIISVNPVVTENIYHAKDLSDVAGYLQTKGVYTPEGVMQDIIKIAQSNLSICSQGARINPEPRNTFDYRQREMEHVCRKSRELLATIALRSRSDRVHATSAFLAAHAKRRAPAAAPAAAPAVAPAAGPAGGKSRRKHRKSKNRKSKTAKRRGRR